MMRVVKLSSQLLAYGLIVLVFAFTAWRSEANSDRIEREAVVRAEELEREAEVRAEGLRLEAVSRAAELRAEALARADGLKAEAIARAEGLQAEAIARAEEVSEESLFRTRALCDLSNETREGIRNFVYTIVSADGEVTPEEHEAAAAATRQFPTVECPPVPPGR